MDDSVLHLEQSQINGLLAICQFIAIGNFNPSGSPAAHLLLRRAKPNGLIYVSPAGSFKNSLFGRSRHDNLKIDRALPDYFNRRPQKGIGMLTSNPANGQSWSGHSSSPEPHQNQILEMVILVFLILPEKRQLVIVI